MSDAATSPGAGQEAVLNMPKAESAGSLLKKAREAQGMHIAMLAVSLKVPVKKLELLEANQFHLLPDMVFVRALACSICRTLKVDEQVVLSALPRSELRRVSAVEDRLKPRFHDTGYASDRSFRKNFKSPWGIALMLVLAAIAAILLWPERSYLATPGASLPGAVPMMSASQPQEVMAVNANVVQEPSPNATVVLPATAVATAFSTQGATYDGGPLRLVATGASWVEVTGSDGVVLLRRNLIQGESIGLSGKLPLSVVLGRADLVTVWVRDQSFDTNAFSKENVARFEVK